MIFSPNRLHVGGSWADRKQSQMWCGRLLRACLVTLAFLAAVAATRPAHAQANFDRPGGDYQSSPVESGDPADCALVCERDRRCRAWSFNYPTDIAGGVVEPRNGAIETSIDRAGGDYRSFELKSGDGDDECKAACTGDNKCRAWTYARPGSSRAWCGNRRTCVTTRRHCEFGTGFGRP